MNQKRKAGNSQPSDSLARTQKKKKKVSSCTARRRLPQSKMHPPKDWVLSVTVLMSVGGVFVLALNGENYGEAYVDITTYMVAAYFGRQILPPRQN